MNPNKKYCSCGNVIEDYSSSSKCHDCLYREEFEREKEFQKNKPVDWSMKRDNWED